MSMSAIILDRFAPSDDGAKAPRRIGIGREDGVASLGGPQTCWVMTDGTVGMEVQTIGLARAMGLTPQIRRIRLRQPWRTLAPYLRVGLRHAFELAEGALEPPWPDIVIGCGRPSVLPVLAVRRLSGGRSFAVQIQDPRIPPSAFDLVIVPSHDRLRGDSVLVSLGGLGKVTRSALDTAAIAVADSVADLPHPRVAVLIGGTNRVFRFTEEAAAALGRSLADLARNGVGLLVTPSRRTDPHVVPILRRALAGTAARIWDGTGDNPYLGYLGLADAVIATGDSVNMISEAGTTGRPVHVVMLPGGSPKFDRFHTAMTERGVTRPFTGSLEDWHYVPLDETARMALAVKDRYASLRPAV